MPAPLAVPLIAAGTQLLGGLFNAGQRRRTAKQNTDKTIAHQRWLAEYQYNKDLEMWNRQNQYNDPKSQMSRLKGAGLNPHLVYGSGSVAGNTGSSMPQYRAEKPEYNYQPMQVDTPAVIGQYQDLAIKQAQYENLKAQNKQTDAQTGLILANTDRAGIRANVDRSVWTDDIKLRRARAKTELNKHSLQGLDAENRAEQLRWLRAGMRPGDSIWMRLAMQMLPQLGVPKSVLQSIFSPAQMNLLYNQKIRKR